MNGLDASYFRGEAWRSRITAAARAPAPAVAWAHPGPTSRLKATTRRSACLSKNPEAAERKRQKKRELHKEWRRRRLQRDPHAPGSWKRGPGKKGGGEEPPAVT